MALWIERKLRVGEVWRIVEEGKSLYINLFGGLFFFVFCFFFVFVFSFNKFRLRLAKL